MPENKGGSVFGTHNRVKREALPASGKSVPKTAIFGTVPPGGEMTEDGSANRPSIGTSTRSRMHGRHEALAYIFTPIWSVPFTDRLIGIDPDFPYGEVILRSAGIV